MAERALEYFKRSFFAVDGLWFVMLEEADSFDKALEIDERVWRAMPKIQSRKIRELYGIGGNGLRDLLRALEAKFGMEGYRASFEAEGDRALILIHECPWFEIMKRAGRGALAGRIGERICKAEYRAWADEFDEGIGFSLDSQLCKGDDACRLRFQYEE
ncbi:MAG: DUF6125 family protein [Candidatus Bathyarchaeia archaeon]